MHISCIGLLYYIYYNRTLWSDCLCHKCLLYKGLNVLRCVLVRASRLRPAQRLSKTYQQHSALSHACIPPSPGSCAPTIPVCMSVCTRSNRDQHRVPRKIDLYPMYRYSTVRASRSRIIDDLDHRVFLDSGEPTSQYRRVRSLSSCVNIAEAYPCPCRNLREEDLLTFLHIIVKTKCSKHGKSTACRSGKHQIGKAATSSAAADHGGETLSLSAALEKDLRQPAAQMATRPSAACHDFSRLSGVNFSFSPRRRAHCACSREPSHA